jgi:hypothetical protein
MITEQETTMVERRKGTQAWENDYGTRDNDGRAEKRNAGVGEGREEKKNTRDKRLMDSKSGGGRVVLMSDGRPPSPSRKGAVVTITLDDEPCCAKQGYHRKARHHDNSLVILSKTDSAAGRQENPLGFNAAIAPSSF